MTLVYLTGQAHSGSTLLALLLGSHSGAVTLGEAFALSERRQRARRAALTRRGRTDVLDQLDKPCMCGAPTIRACPFWHDLDARLRALGGLDALDVEHPSPERFARDNRALVESAAASRGAHVVIDSTKSIARLERLREVPGLDVVTVYLTRAPAGVVQSLRRKRIPWPTARVAWSTWRRRRALRGVPHVAVRYEDLAAAPETTLRRLMPRLGLAFEPAQLDWWEHSHHLIAGNRMRRRPAPIRLDEAWRETMPRWRQHAARAADWLARAASPLSQDV